MIRKFSFLSLLMVATALAVPPPARGADQSVTIQQQPDTAPSVVRLFATYRTASGGAASTRDIVWIHSEPGVVALSGDARMRYVRAVPMRSGFTWLKASATVSGRLYADSLPIAVGEITMLRAQVGQPPVQLADSLVVYAKGHAPFQTVHAIVGDAVQFCAMFLRGGSPILDTCVQSELQPYYQQLRDAWQVSRQMWVIASR